MPRKNIKSVIVSKMNLLSGNAPATEEGLAKSQTKMENATDGNTCGVNILCGGDDSTVEDKRSAHDIRKLQSSTCRIPTPQQEKHQYVHLSLKRTTSTENNSCYDEGGTYAKDTVTTVTGDYAGEAPIAGFLQSVSDVFKCVMNAADPRCAATFPTSGASSTTEDDPKDGPPTNITVRPPPRGTETNQFERKPLLEDMESLVRVRLRKPLGIVFISNGTKGVRIYEIPRDGMAYRKAKPSLAVGDELLSVNGVDMTRRSFNSVMNYIQRVDTSKDKMDLIFRRPSKLGKV